MKYADKWLNEGYQKVANKKDLQEGGLLKVEPGSKPIVLAMANGKVHAMDAVCSHEGRPLEEGTLEGYNLTCPWHYAIFDVRNAKVSDQTVWATDLNSYPVLIDEDSGDIFVNPKVSGKDKEKISTQPSAEEKVTETTQQLQEQRKRGESEPSQFNLRLSPRKHEQKFWENAISSNLGFIVGPALAGSLGVTIYGEKLPALAALSLLLSILVVINFTLKESKSSSVIVIPEKERQNVGKVFAFECKEC